MICACRFLCYDDSNSTFSVVHSAGTDALVYTDRGSAYPTNLASGVSSVVGRAPFQVLSAMDGSVLNTILNAQQKVGLEASVKLSEAGGVRRCTLLAKPRHGKTHMQHSVTLFFFKISRS